MFQLSFGMMEFWINGLLDLFIIPVFLPIVIGITIFHSIKIKIS